MFTPEEFLQERNINSYYEQDRIRKLANKFVDTLVLNRHYLAELQEECKHPTTAITNDVTCCVDCHKTWKING